MRITPVRVSALCLRHAIAVAVMASLLAVWSVRECAAAEAHTDSAAGARVRVARLALDAYAPSPLAVRTPPPNGSDIRGDDPWSVEPPREPDPPSRLERWAGTGALIGAGVGVSAAVVRTRGDDGLADLFEPLLWCIGGLAGAAVGGAIGGAIALATGG